MQVAAIRTKPAIAAARVPKDSGDILGTTGRHTFPSCPMQRGQPAQDLKEPLSWYPGIDPRALCRWQLAQVVGAQTPHGSTAKPERFQLAPHPHPPLGTAPLKSVQATRVGKRRGRGGEGRGGGSTESLGEPRCLKGVHSYVPVPGNEEKHF